jgi:hypothetical protein
MVNFCSTSNEERRNASQSFRAETCLAKRAAKDDKRRRTQLETLPALWKQRLDRHIALFHRFLRQREGRRITGSAHRT